MDCGECSERFDAARRRPKVLPCGHSACLACLQRLEDKHCPECQLQFPSAAEALPDNVYLLNYSETTRRQPRPSLWCSDCQAVAKADCLDEHEHDVRNPKTVLKAEVAQLAEELPEALRVDGERCPEQALRALRLARQVGTGLELTVRGQRGEAMSATWTAPAAPAGHAVATSVLVLALAKEGAWQEHGAEGQREGDKQDQEEGLEERAEATGELPVMEELAVEEDPSAQHKQELLQIVRRHRVRRLTKFDCYEDPTWRLQLLQLAAPHLEELQVHHARRDELLAVHAMPKLRWLFLIGKSIFQSDYPAELPPLPAHHAGLRSLCVLHLPRETTLSLLRAHASTLEELELDVGTPGGGDWPDGCDDLHAALERCGLVRLRRLLLWRQYNDHGYGDDDGKDCPAQLSAVRGALPGVQVQCSDCDDVELAF